MSQELTIDLQTSTYLSGLEVTDDRDVNFYNHLPFAEIDDIELCTLLTDTTTSESITDHLNTECFEYGTDETPNHITPIKYYLGSEFKESINSFSENQLSLLHLNARSLSQNFDQIHSYIASLDFQFSIIAHFRFA